MLDTPDIEPRIDVGVFGGSGFYEFLDGFEAVTLDTPYGPPSDPLHVGEVGGRVVAFLPRHGVDHRHMAHRVNYRANVWALAALGARAIIGPFACGSLRPELAPGHLVVVDQLVDRTHSRKGTFFDGPEVWHQPFAEPYHEEHGRVIGEVARGQGMTVHLGGTVVVIPGPRFSTRAEADWHRTMGWDLVNMTQAPEAALAAEAGVPYVGLGLVTDYDTGTEHDPAIGAVTQEGIFALLDAHAGAMRELLVSAIPRLAL